MTDGSGPVVLVSVGGLPAAGKTTIARLVAARLGAAYVRIDTIEATIARAEGRHEPSNGWLSPPGYEVGYAVAADQLEVGTDVVAESVNALHVTRDAWRDVAERRQARLLEVEVVCSDSSEHRRRVETRRLDVEDLTGPTWEQVRAREYQPWVRDRLVLDTAHLLPHDAAALVCGTLTML